MCKCISNYNFDNVEVGDIVTTWNNHSGKVVKIFSNKYFGKEVRIQETVNGVVYTYTFPIRDIVETKKEFENEM